MESEFIKATEGSLLKFISNNQEGYKIPSYQRAYSWGKEQWEDLLNDIKDLKENEKHFIGSIVVIPEIHKQGLNFFDIVDGQQRMATIFNLLILVRDLSIEKVAKDINDYLFVKEVGGEAKPKLLLSTYDQGEFEKLLNKETAQLNKKHNITKCYCYFRERLEKEEIDITRLMENILYKISLVHINAISLLNAFKLFETLNDRGLELSAVDLIKNFILKESAASGQFNKVRELWEEMYAKVKNKEPVKFMRRYMLSNYSGVMPEMKLYEYVKEKIDKFANKDEEILKLVACLNDSADIYKSIYDSDTDDDEFDARLKDLNLIQVATSYSLLLKLFPLYQCGQLTKLDFFEVLRYIEIFHIRWGICDQSTSELDVIYNGISMQLNDSLSSQQILGIVKKTLQEKTKNITEDFFKTNFISKDFNASDSRTKYILWCLDDKKSDVQTMHLETINTEHIMPKNLTEEWISYLCSKDIKVRKEDIEELHEDNLNKIGNLTLLEHRWNKSMKDSLFEIKKAGNAKMKGYKDSKFIYITKEIAIRFPKWTFQEIELRTLELATKAASMWKF